MQSNKLFNIKTIISLVVVFFLTFGLTYAVFPVDGGSLISPKAENVEKDRVTSGFGQFADKPKTEACPINGALYSKEEKALWEAKMPLLAMIENHIDARPQSGLGSADIVYEAVAEGGITRFMGVFYCGAQTDTMQVGPVRSARIYFVNLAAEFNTPIYMHVGGGNCSRDEASGQCTSNKKAFALEELVKMGWRKPKGNDFDTIGDIGVPVMKRNETRLGREVATEHTYMGYLNFAWKEATKRGFTNLMADGKTWLSGYKSWKFGDVDTSKSAPATTISYEFWKNNPDFVVNWKYDSVSKTYQRSQGATAHIDFDTKKQIAVTNVIVQFAKEEGPLDDHKHMFYDVISSGTGKYFHDGVVDEIKWKKTKQAERTVYTDLTGKEITFTPGQFWVSILPIGNKVVYN
jgi:hypothetical protein